MTRIVIDDREKNGKVCSIFENRIDVDVVIERLEIGDYSLDNLIVERKTYSDFCDSIKDGRLFRQAVNLARSRIQPLIILEYNPNGIGKNFLRREAILGALITLSILYAIPVLHSKSAEETARLILQTTQQIEMFGTKDRRWRRPQPSKNAKREKRKMQLHLLQGFPGIGPTRADQLLEKFGTIKNIVNLTGEELQTMNGFNEALVLKILHLIS